MCISALRCTQCTVLNLVGGKNTCPLNNVAGFVEQAEFFYTTPWPKTKNMNCKIALFN